MTSPSIIRVNDVSKRFVLHKHKSLKERIVSFNSARRHREDFWALRDINLDIELGTTVGLVGHNGSGKSTLLKVIGGIIEPTSGSVQRRGRMAALLELGAGFHPDLTGRENVYLNAAILGLNQREIDRYFDSIVDFSGIEEFIDTQVKFYSSGMYVRLAFAVAVHVDPDLLLVDEVLAVGDEPFQRKCMDKITEFQREGRTIVVVSHSASQVGRLCDRVVVMNHGEMVFDGGPADGLRVLRFGYEEQRLHEERSRGVAVSSTSRAHISSIAIKSDEAIDKKTVRSGDDMTIEFAYSLTEKQPPLIAGIAIETAQGEPIYGLNTKMLNLVLPTEPGAHSVDFAFTRQAIGAGQFVLRGSLETTDGDSLDRLNPASSFSIYDPPAGTGYVRLDVEARIRA
jgi:ABC-2 type transport system ATP-binding protein